MTRWAVVVGGCAAAALVLAAGCDVPGRAVADPAAVRQVSKQIRAGSVFGDGATVDPCSIVDVNDATAVQDVEFAPADALDDCALDVYLHDGTDTYVDVGPLESTDDDIVPMSSLRLVQALPGGMSLRMDKDASDGYCQAYLVFPDGYDLVVGASDSQGNSTKEACAAAQAMTRDVAGQVEAGALRHLTYPAGSVALLDPCGLLPDAALAAAELRDALVTPYPENHECLWQPAPGAPPTWLTLRFPIGELTVDDPATDKRVTIAGRPSVTRSYAYSGTPGCYVDTDLGSVPTGRQNQFNDGAMQLAELDLDVPPGSSADACALATTLAAVAWPALAHAH